MSEICGCRAALAAKNLSEQSDLAIKLIGMEERDGPQGNQGVHMRNFKYACALMIQNIMNM